MGGGGTTFSSSIAARVQWSATISGSVRVVALLLISGFLLGRSGAWAQTPTGSAAASASASDTPTNTPTPSAPPTVTPQQIDATQWGFGTIGFLFGFFLTYSITIGSKTQDLLKSTLGVASVGGGLLGTQALPPEAQLPGVESYGLGAVIGFGVYFATALILSVIYAYGYEGQSGNSPPPEKSWKALFAAAVARAVLGEDLRPLPAAAGAAEGSFQAGTGAH